MTEQKMDVT